MKNFKRILTMALALVMTFIYPVQAMASGRSEYISEIRLGYGDEGKANLEAEGFTVWTDLNANEGGEGSAVWVGYITTDDPDEAITDVALMNMKGGYSFDAYTEEVAELNRQVSELLANFTASIEEFRDNYADGSIYAQEALKIMNCFYEDDTLDSDGEPMRVGDLLLDEDTPEETLHRIFLEGNIEALNAIEQSLVLGCIEIGEENVLTRIEDAEYPDKLDPELSSARSNILAAFEDLHSTASAIQELYEEAEAYDGGIEGFLSRENLSDEEKYTFATKLNQYVILVETDFGNTGMTLLDFSLLDEEEVNEDGEILEEEYLEMLAQAMTAGQRSLVGTASIMTILSNAAAGTDTSEAESLFEKLNEDDTFDESISVYYNVDRTLFSDTDGIALTSDALREKASNEGSDFGKDSSADKTKAIVLTAVSAVAMTAGVLITILGAKMYSYATAYYSLNYGVSWVYDFMVDFGVNLGFYTNVPLTAGGCQVLASVITTVVGVVAIIAAVVLAIFAILDWIEKPETRKVEYTQIPRVIVERPAGQREFITYYAAKLAGAAEDETDSLALYGDLNALNTQDEWLALYYTKNSTMGSPITAEMLIQDNGTLKSSNSEKYSPVHMFGSSSAANLNQYNTGSGAESIYVFLLNDGSASGQAGSVFTSGSVMMSLITFLAGAGISAAVTYGLTKKKKVVTA